LASRLAPWKPRNWNIDAVVARLFVAGSKSSQVVVKVGTWYGPVRLLSVDPLATPPTISTRPSSSVV